MRSTGFWERVQIDDQLRHSLNGAKEKTHQSHLPKTVMQQLRLFLIIYYVQFGAGLSHGYEFSPVIRHFVLDTTCVNWMQNWCCF